MARDLSQASTRSAGTFSAPATAHSRAARSSALALRSQGRRKVGVPTVTVAPSSRAAATFAAVSTGDGRVMSVVSRERAYQTPTVKPKEWKTGRLHRRRARRGTAPESSIWERFASRLACVSGTPLGSPELPLVKSRPASRSPPSRGRPRTRGMSSEGVSRTSRATAAIFARGRPRRKSATSRVSSVQGKSGKRSPTFARKASAVSIVRTPARRRLDSAAARPAVKLRLTGTLSAKAQARLATAAPMPAGSTMPTRRSGSSRRRRARSQARASVTAPPRARRPAVRSTMTSRPARRARPLAVSAARWPRREGRVATSREPTSSRRVRAEAASDGGKGAP